MKCTVDGSEIRRSPDDMVVLSHYLRRVLAPSQVGFHQQYPIVGSTEPLPPIAGLMIRAYEKPLVSGFP